MRVFILGLLLLLLAADCAYRVPSTASTAAFAGTSRIETPTGYALTSELAPLKRDADQVYVCSAHAYPIDADAAIADPIDAESDVARHILLALEDLPAISSFKVGWCSGTAHSDISPDMRATITDAPSVALFDRLLCSFGKEDSERDFGANALSKAEIQII